MPKGMQAIYTQTVGAGGASFVMFNNIPQTYTDLYIIGSTRDSSSGAVVALQYTIEFNADNSTSYNGVWLRNFNNSANTFNGTNQSAVTGGYSASNGMTANSFSASTVYIPQYSVHGVHKTVMVESAAESNTANYDSANYSLSILYRSQAPITSIKLSGGFMQNSSFSLYGISR
jgi:hypothetical protein